MELIRPQDIFSLSPGDVVSKRNLFDLIQFSKIQGSKHWGGDDFQIGNTPQQGINWMGQLPHCHAILIKTKAGSYAGDGWKDAGRTSFRYSFKAKEGIVSYAERANAVLIAQPEHQYPILLFSEKNTGWTFEGIFKVSEIDDKSVQLIRGLASEYKDSAGADLAGYREGDRKYVTHLLAERSRGVVKALKEISQPVCEICGVNFALRYGVNYIEAHHKTPIATYSSAYEITTDDLALLCPNCHRAVHAHMKMSGLEYDEIKTCLQTQETPTQAMANS